MVDLLFYLLAVLATVAAVGVVVARSPVVSVVSLLACFGALAVIYLLAGFQFLAAIQILVYGGAVMVLFLFTVMLLNLGDVEETGTPTEPLFHGSRRSLLGVAVATAMGAAVLVALVRVPWGSIEEAAVPLGGFDPLNELAVAMFTRYSLAFEAASVLLLATTVGVLVIAKRNRPGNPAGAAPTRRAAPNAPNAPNAPDAPHPAGRNDPEREEVLS